jgi:hypothetical protein
MLHHVAPPNLALDQMLRPQLGAECKERKKQRKGKRFLALKIFKGQEVTRYDSQL